MKKRNLVIFHILFWIFTSLLTTLVYQLSTLPSAVLGSGFLSIDKQFIAIIFILIIGICIFYASYFSFIYFVNRITRFIGLFVGYLLVILGFIIINLSKEVDMWEILIVFLPILYFNFFGFLFKTFIEWIKERKEN